MINQEIKEIISNDSFLKAFLFDKSKRVLISPISEAFKDLTANKEYFYYGVIENAETIIINGSEYPHNNILTKLLFNQITFSEINENSLFQGLKIEIL